MSRPIMWTEEKAAALFARYGTTDTATLAAERGQTVHQFHGTLYKLTMRYPHLDKPSKDTYHHYTPEERDFVIAHYNRDMAPLDVAKHIGVTGEQLRAKVLIWRREGADIAYKAKEIGTVRTITSGGREQTHVKTDSGWKYVRKEKKAKPARPKSVLHSVKPRKTAEQKEAERRQKETQALIRRELKRREKAKQVTKRESITYDYNPEKVIVKNRDEGKVLVKVDHKTWKYMQPDRARQYGYCPP